MLGFDTSTAATSACVLRADGEAFEVVPAAGAARAAARARRASCMPAIADVLERGGLDWARARRDRRRGRARARSPGLRIGVATARALAHAHGAAAAAGVVARGAGRRHRRPGCGCPLIDARRGEVFAALYRDDEERWAPWRRPRSEVAERLRAAELDPAGGRGRLGTISGRTRGGRRPRGARRIAGARGARAARLPARRSRAVRRSRGGAARLPAPSRRQAPTDDTETIEIRRLTYADLPQVIAIERRAFPTPWSLAMFVLELSKPSGICLAARRATGAVGYLVCSRYDTVWHLMNVAVDDRRAARGHREHADRAAVRRWPTGRASSTRSRCAVERRGDRALRAVRLPGRRPPARLLPRQPRGRRDHVAHGPGGPVAPQRPGLILGDRDELRRHLRGARHARRARSART